MLVAVSAAATIIRGLRLSPRLLAGWITKNVFLLLVLLVVGLLRPSIAGFVAAAGWGALVLAPTLLQRLVVRASLRGRQAEAGAFARAVGVLHPFDGFREQARLYRGLEAEQRGDVEAAAAIYEALMRSRSAALAPIAAMHYYRATEQWEAYGACALRLVDGGGLGRNPSVLIHCLRALGEIGRIEEMVRLHHDCRRITERGLPPGARLTVLAFGGRTAAVEGLLETKLSALPASARELWRATAELAAGAHDHGRARLGVLLEDPDRMIGSLARVRLARPPPVAADALSTEAQSILSRLEEDLEQEARYRPSYGDLRRHARATWALVTASLAVFCVEVLAGGSTDPHTLFSLGAVDAARVLDGEIWRLFAATFLHFGPLHLILNMIGLAFFGPFVERMLGWRRFLVVYVVAGFGGMSAVVIKAWWLHESVLLVGASAGIMGLLGATAFLFLRGWRREHSRPARAQLSQIVLILALQTGFDLSIAEVSFTAHFFGMLIGFLAGAAVRGGLKKATNACALVASMASERGPSLSSAPRQHRVPSRTKILRISLSPETLLMIHARVTSPGVFAGTLALRRPVGHVQPGCSIWSKMDSDATLD